MLGGSIQVSGSFDQNASGQSSVGTMRTKRQLSVWKVYYAVCAPDPTPIRRVLHHPGIETGVFAWHSNALIAMPPPLGVLFQQMTDV